MRTKWNRLVGALFGAAIELSALHASAEILVDIEPYAAAASGSYESLLAFIEFQIEQGFADNSHYVFTVKAIDGDVLIDDGLEVMPGEEVDVEVAKATWDQWVPGIKYQVLELLGRSLGSVVTAYHVSVSHQARNLAGEPLIAVLAIDLSVLPEHFEAKRLLSPFVMQYAEEEITSFGPNCWYTSIAAVSADFDPPRFMNEAEFACHLRRSFVEVGEANKVGDVIRLRDQEGNDVHACTYIGRDRSALERQIVLTKNGKTPGGYLFMDFDAVRALYPDSMASYYRRYMSEDPKVPANIVEDCTR